jgi:hypothetical protein
MARKTFAVIAPAILAVFAVPAAANAAGYVPAGNVSLSGNAVPGGTATGLTSGTVGTAAITVTAVDAGSGTVNTGNGTANNGSGDLASTGYDAPVLLIWGAGGALLLGIALVVVLTAVRRQRATA